VRFQNLAGLVGANNAGKTNLLRAIDLILGPKWPKTRFDPSDFCDFAEEDQGYIKLYFDSPLYADYYGTPYEVYGFALTFTPDGVTDFVCLDETGDPVTTRSGRELWVTNEIREQIPSIYIGVDRSLEVELRATQWTVLGRILKSIAEKFAQDSDRKVRFERLSSEFTTLLRTPEFEEFEREIRKGVIDITGLKDIQISFRPPEVLGAYRNLELQVIEFKGRNAEPVTRMGAGIQSSVVVALIEAYYKIKGTGALFLIEEPEVYLHPHGRRHFFRVLQELSRTDNQIIFATHASEFIDLSEPQWVIRTVKDPVKGTRFVQLPAVPFDEDRKRRMKHFLKISPDQNEVIFAKGVILVEGKSERLTLPILLEKAGKNLDAIGYSIMEAEGGKDDLPFYINFLKQFDFRFIVIFDEDSQADNYETYHKKLNQRIQEVAGSGNFIMLSPNFESLLGLPPTERGKPEHAVRKALEIDQLPEFIRSIVAWLPELS
jgi:ABC-type transport system involved in cytochrome c biogenesis ATPase subunit